MRLLSSSDIITISRISDRETPSLEDGAKLSHHHNNHFVSVRLFSQTIVRPGLKLCEYLSNNVFIRAFTDLGGLTGISETQPY